MQECAFEPSARVRIEAGENRFTDHRQTVEPAERLDHDIGRGDVFFEVVQQGVRCVDSLRPDPVFEMKLSLIGSGYLTHHILGFEDDGKLIGLMMVAEGLVTDGGVEKAGEAECLVVPESFQVTAQRLRAHIDAKYRLGLGPNRHGSAGRGFFRAGNALELPWSAGFV